LDAGDAAPHLPHPGGVFELSARALKAQVENLLAHGFELFGQLVIGPGAHIGGLGSLHGASSSPGRTTKRVAIGSLAAANSKASRAILGSTPSSSNMIRPGLTRAIQNSGE